MHRNDFLAIATFILSCIFIAFAYGPTFNGASLDFALHLSLVNFISSNLSFPNWASIGQSQHVSTLGVMTFYPPIAHASAALFGKIFHSDVLGILVIGKLSVFLPYVVVNYAMMKDRNLAGSLLFTIFITIFASYRIFHGDELIGNFFFAQSFGFALMIACLYACIMIFDGWMSIILASLMSYLLGHTYLLSQIEFSAAFTLFLFTELIEKRRAKAVIKTASLQLLFAVGLLGAITALHPQFAVMRQLSANDGAIDPNFRPLLIAIFSLAALFISLLAWFVSGERSCKSLRMAYCLSAAVAIIALGQYAALILIKSGSPYAVRKFTFDIFTTATLTVSALIGCRFASKRIDFTTSPAGNVIAASLAGCFLVYRVFHGFAAVNASAFVDTIQFEKQIITYDLPADAFGHTASLLHDISSAKEFDPILNVSLDQLVLGATVDQGVEFSYDHKTDGLTYALVNTDNPLSKQVECVHSKFTHVGIVGVNFPCAIHKAQSVAYNVSFPSMIDGVVGAQLSNGWSKAEPDGVWSSGKESTIDFIINDSKAPQRSYLHLFFADTFVNAQHPTQRVVAKVDDEKVAEKTYELGAFPNSFVVPLPDAAVSRGIVRVTLSLPDAVSPATIGMQPDPRILAIKLRSFEITGDADQ